MRRQEQQRLVLEGALAAHVDRLERVGPVVRDVPVELLVLGLVDLVPRARPERLHRVERLLLAGGRAVLAGLVDSHPDRPRDEVGVALDDLADRPLGGVVVQVVVGVDRLEVQRDRGALGRVLDLLDRVGALARGLPAGAAGLPGAAGQQRHPVGDHEGRVEADAELADQLLGRGGVGGLAQLAQQLGGAGLRDRADQADHLVAVHADAVVPHSERTGVLVDLDLDVQVGGVRRQFLVDERLQPQLVQRVGRVRDQFAQEDVLVRVDRVHHQLQQLTSLGLELQRLDAVAHTDSLSSGGPTAERIRGVTAAARTGRPGNPLVQPVDGLMCSGPHFCA